MFTRDSALARRGLVGLDGDIHTTRRDLNVAAAERVAQPLPPGRRVGIPWHGRGRVARRRPKAPPRTVHYKDRSGEWQKRRLADCGDLDPAELFPVRDPGARRGRIAIAGYLYYRSAELHVPFESSLERDVLLCLDFDRSVGALQAQPFEIRDGDGEPICPDVFAQTVDGPVVIEAKERKRLSSEAVRARLDRTAAACDVAGWRFEVRTRPERDFLRNLWFCRGAVPSPEIRAELAGPILRRAREGASVEEALPPRAHKSLSRTVLLSLIWDGELRCDLSKPLSNQTKITTTEVTR